MDEPELERAGAHIRGAWDEARIERTLRATKRRRVRRIVQRGGMAVVAVAALAWFSVSDRLPDGPAAPQLATQSGPAVQPSIQAPTPSPEMPVTQPESAVRGAQASVTPKAAEVRATDDTGTRSTSTRARMAATEHRNHETWRVQLARGDARGAFERLQRERPELRTLDDLMLAADAARRAGEPRSAVTFLERALSQYHDARTAVVAFTLGKLLRDELARPEAAARAFAEVEARSKDAPLLADALAREVEALDAAGQRERARTRAKLYLSRYPHGERRAWIERLVTRP